MPKFTFTSPEGRKFTVTAPEGATEDDAVKHLMLNNDEFRASVQKSVTKDIISNPLRSAKLPDEKVKEFKSKSGLEQTMINAGIGAKGALKGAKQIFGMDDATPAETIAEGNTRKQLGEAQGKIIGPLAQATGAIAATAPIAALGGSPSTLGTALVQGGVQGLLEPSYNPEQNLEDKLKTTAIGAAAGVGTQAGMNAVRGLYRNVAPVFSQKAAERAAARTALKEVGGRNVPMLASVLREADEVTPVGTPMTSMMAAQGDPGLAALERSSRLNPNTAGGWNIADMNANQQRAQFLRDTLGNVDERVANTRAVRDAATTAQRDVALRTANSSEIGTDLIGRLARVRSGDYEVNKLLDDLRTALRKNPDAEMVYTLRKGLTESGHTSNGAVMEAIQAIDDTLESRVGPNWKNYLNRYTELSGPVNEAEALKGISNRYFDPVSGRPVGATLGGDVRVSGDDLSRALRQFGYDNARGRTSISEGVRGNIQALIDEERLATTARDVIASSAVDQTGEKAVSDAIVSTLAAKTGAPGPVANTMNRIMGGRARAEGMARLLRDPKKMADLLEQVNYQGTTRFEDLGRNALSEYLRSQ